MHNKKNLACIYGNPCIRLGAFIRDNTTYGYSQDNTICQLVNAIEIAEIFLWGIQDSPNCLERMVMT